MLLDGMKCCLILDRGPGTIWEGGFGISEPPFEVATKLMWELQLCCSVPDDVVFVGDENSTFFCCFRSLFLVISCCWPDMFEHS